MPKQEVVKEDWFQLAAAHHRRACIVSAGKTEKWSRRDLERRERDLKYAFLGYYFSGSKAVYEALYLLCLVQIEKQSFKSAERTAMYAYNRILSRYGDYDRYSAKFLGLLCYIAFETKEMALAELRLKEYLGVYADRGETTDYNDILKLYFSTQIKLGRSFFKDKQYHAARLRFENALLLLGFVYSNKTANYHRLQFFIRQSIEVLQQLTKHNTTIN